MPVWCTNRSLSPSSGVMKPNPLSSLNHFTVPVGMWELLHGMFVLRRGGCCLELRPASACTAFAGLLCRPDAHDRSRSPPGCVVEMFSLHACPIGSRRRYRRSRDPIRSGDVEHTDSPK